MALPAFTPSAPVLKPRGPSAESARRTNAAPAPAAGRSVQVLQSRREPAQLCLFLRSGAGDVK